MPREITALQKAVEFLARREHSQHELHNKLSARGFSEQEIDMTTKYNFEETLLGPRVLRTETAALTAITALQVRFGDLG